MKSKCAYKKRRKRIGRGNGSGHGKTSCKGEKGQLARAGASLTPGFEGGQMTFVRRLPKRGFNNVRFRKAIEIVNIKTLALLQETEVDPQKLCALGLIKRKFDGIKVLGKGALKKPITVHAHYFSARAKSAIEEAGGKTVVIEKIQIDRNKKKD